MEFVTENFALGLILNPKNQMLLQRKDEAAWFWPNYWCTFGGHIKKGESPLETLVREIKEEIGLTLSNIELFEITEFEELAKAGPKKGELTRKGKNFVYSARFGGDLKKIRLGEGAGFSVFDFETISKYGSLGLIMPHVYSSIERFYKTLHFSKSNL